MTEWMTSAKTHLRIAAIGDLHVSRTHQGSLQPLFTQISSSADVLLLCGDFTDYGLPDEARVLARVTVGGRLGSTHAGATEVTALSNLDLELRAGDFVHANAETDHSELWTDEGCRVLLVVPPEDYFPVPPQWLAHGVISG